MKYNLLTAIHGALFGYNSHAKSRYAQSELVSDLKDGHEIKTFIDPIFNKEVKIDMTEHKVIREDKDE